MNKQETIDYIENKPEIQSKELIHLIKSITLEPKTIPSKIKKGDVYLSVTGAKARPHVVIKVVKDIAYSMPLSTTQDSLNLMPYNSRMFGTGYYSKSIVSSKIDIVKRSFIGVFDNPKELNIAIRTLQSLILSL